jgi:periplasmic divalent cation tolerance protein
MGCPILFMLAANERKYAVALVTAPDIKTARKLARAALEARLAACANLLPKVESHYWWQGKLERGNEVLIVFKTTRRLLGRLEALVVQQHPYDTPEFIVLAITGGNRRYLKWCGDSVTG